MVEKPSTIDEAIAYVWAIPDTMIGPADKQSLAAALAEKTDAVARRYFSVPNPELWVGTLRELLKPTGTSDEVLLALDEINRSQLEIKSLLQVYSVLQLDRFMYTEGKVTRQQDPLAHLFSRKPNMGLCRVKDVGVCSQMLFYHPLQSLAPTCSSGNGLNMFTCLDSKTSMMSEMGCHCGSL